MKKCICISVGIFFTESVFSIELNQHGCSSINEEKR